MSEALTGPRPERIGLVRRLAAAAYDAFALFGLLFGATALVLPLNDGEAIRPGHPWHVPYIVYLAVVTFGYFGLGWTRGGQTLGMRAWRIRLRAAAGGAADWRTAAVRFVVAIVSWAACGLGFLWAVLDREGRAWHDIASRTRLQAVPRVSAPSAPATSPPPPARAKAAPRKRRG
ncbi:MAG: RDD family protein [Ectothiorhodospiraceae bacterium]|nr:RDD family protein [Chromatiales bacterium]MCP5155001.1 RDD family protein [Ectothiorhodospiraceae bacterium]